MRSWNVMRTAAALGAAVLMTGTLALSASPAMASAGACGGGAFGYPYYAVCTDVSGSGLHINYLSGQFFNHYIDSGVNNVHIQLYGPNGTIKNCGQVNVGAQGNGPTCTWSPNSNEPAGDYCGRAWQWLGGSDYQELAEECIDVHT
jgi:hypothetical protein